MGFSLFVLINFNRKTLRIPFELKCALAIVYIEYKHNKNLNKKIPLDFDLSCCLETEISEF